MVGLPGRCLDGTYHPRLSLTKVEDYVSESLAGSLASSGHWQRGYLDGEDVTSRCGSSVCHSAWVLRSVKNQHEHKLPTRTL